MILKYVLGLATLTGLVGVFVLFGTFGEFSSVEAVDNSGASIIESVDHTADTMESTTSNDSTNRGISANDCAADPHCEANGVIVGDPVAHKIPPETSNGVIAEGAIASQRYIKSYGPGFFDEYINVGDVLAKVWGSVNAANVVYAVNELQTDGTIQAGSLAGHGNAFACVDASGKLYRSQHACN